MADQFGTGITGCKQCSDDMGFFHDGIAARNSKDECHDYDNNIKKDNNSELPKGRITATVEFTDAINKEGILENLKRIPLNPKYLDHKFNKYTYPIQDANTRTIINKLKKETSLSNFYFTGRFADWEYYNMDVAIGAAMDLCKTL